MKFISSRQLLLISIPCVSLLLSAPFAAAKGIVKSVAKADVSYNYAGVQFTDQDIDNNNCSQDGIALNGSVEVHENFFALGSYSDLSGNSFCGAKTINLGAGYHTLFNQYASFYGALSFEDVSVDYGRDDSGLILAVGLRGFIHPNLEGKVEVAHHTVFDGNSAVNAGVVYWFNKQFAATGDVSLGTESSGIAVGLRVNF